MKSPSPLISSSLLLDVPRGFNFWRTAHSHGWCDLPPFDFDKENQTLTRLLELNNGVLAHCLLKCVRNDVTAKIQSSRPLNAAERNEIRSLLGACLRTEENLGEFHREAKRYPRYRWIPRIGVGRLLRAPTVFEDIVKMICTTNCSWALTRIMVERLTREFGKSLDGTQYSFPSPQALAGARESFVRKKIRAGYRSPYLVEFANRVASGSLDVEAWRTSSVSTEELFEQVLAVKGVGEYAAGNILRLLGRYDYLALDSWVRGWFYGQYHRGRKVSDKTIQRQFAPFGKWKGLFLWLEATRDWFYA